MTPRICHKSLLPPRICIHTSRLPQIIVLTFLHSTLFDSSFYHVFAGNQIKIGPTISGQPVAPESVPRASRQRPGSSPACPRSAVKVHKAALGCQKDGYCSKECVGSVHGRPKLTPSRAQEDKKVFCCAARSRSIIRASFNRSWSIVCVSAQATNP